jgi:hypothetical protein
MKLSEIHIDVLYLIQYLYPRKVAIDANTVMAGGIVLLKDCKNAAVCSCFLSMFRTSAQKCTHLYILQKFVANTVAE